MDKWRKDEESFNTISIFECSVEAGIALWRASSSLPLSPWRGTGKSKYDGLMTLDEDWTA